MAEVQLERTEPPVTRTGWRLSWGAIFAGLVVALVVQVILTLFGIAFGVGLIGTDTDPQAVGWGAAAWMLLTVLIALFMGGVTTGRMAGVLRTKDATVHGVVLGGLSTIVMLWLVVGGLGMIVGGAFGMVQQAAVQATAPTQPGQDITARVEQQVRAIEQQLPPGDTLVERAGQIVQDAAPHVATGALIAAIGIIIAIGAAVGGVATTAKD